MKDNPMKKISVEKVTLNIGAGKDQAILKKGVQLITELTGIKPVETKSKSRIPNWGLRLGLPIGCKLTLRGKKAEEMLARMLKAKENKIKETQIDETGNVAFGVPEYIDIEGAKYNPDIGIMGLEVCVTLKRPGYRLKSRKIRTKRVGKHHLIRKEEAISFLKEKFKIAIGE